MREAPELLRWYVARLRRLIHPNCLPMDVESDERPPLGQDPGRRRSDTLFTQNVDATTPGLAQRS